MNEREILSIATQTRDAHRRIQDVIRRTPVLCSPMLNERVGAHVFLKLENLQRTGSFKIRGAFNKLLTHQSEITTAGVCAFSSGNHGIAVAEAARHMGTQATIIAPADAPKVKLQAIRKRGATIIPYDRTKDDRQALAAAFSKKTGALLIPAFDDPFVIAGQGTVGEELIEQAAARNAVIDTLLVPCGGGGLIAGVSMPFFRAQSKTDIYAVEPEGFDDTARSLAANERLSNKPSSESLCDSLMTEMPGRVTFPINNARLSGGLTVNDDDVLAAIAYGFNELKIVIEPGGASALAALLSGKLPVRGKTVAVIISGGNIDQALLAQSLNRASKHAKKV